MVRLRSRLAVMAVLVWLVAGCAGEDRDADRSAIRATLAAVVGDFAARDLDGVCEHMTDSAKRHLGVIGHGRPTTCRAGLWKLVRSLPGEDGSQRPGRPRIAAISFDGERALALLRLAGGATMRVPFASNGEAWKLDNFFGITRFPPREG